MRKNMEQETIRRRPELEHDQQRASAGFRGLRQLTVGYWHAALFLPDRTVKRNNGKGLVEDIGK